MSADLHVRPATNAPTVADPAWPSLDPERLGLADTTTVNRHLAHKNSTEEVFVNAIGRDGDLLVALGELPKMHRFFNDSMSPRYEPLVATEFVRQCIEVIAHGLLDVPLTDHFVLCSVELELIRPIPKVIFGRPVHTTVAFAEEQVRRNSDGGVYAIDGPVFCWMDGRPIARFEGTVGFMPHEAYTELRQSGGRAAVGHPQGSVAASDPASVGRRFRENVMIGEIGGLPREAMCLVVPNPHPTFFDRPLDHYPGMMIAEAAYQTAKLALSLQTGVSVAAIRVEWLSMNFASFAELDADLAIELTDWTEEDDNVLISLTARQGSDLRSTFRFRLSPTTTSRYRP